MKLPSALFLLLLLIPGALFAQWKRETGFSVGITSPFNDKEKFSDESSEFMIKLGVTQSWNKPEQRVSFRPEIGLNMEIFPINYSHEGIAFAETHTGTIVALNGGLAAMAQVQILPRKILAIGPSGKFLLTDLTKTVYTYDGLNSQPEVHIHKEFKGFNREYLNKPSLGIKAMLIQQSLSGKVRMGIIFDYQWKFLKEEYFYFSRTMEISFYLELP